MVASSQVPFARMTVFGSIRTHAPWAGFGGGAAAATRSPTIFTAIAATEAHLP